MGLIDLLKRIVLIFIKQDTSLNLKRNKTKTYKPRKRRANISKNVVESVSENLDPINLPTQKIIFDFKDTETSSSTLKLNKPFNRIVKNIVGINFTFDKESYDLFLKEFSNELEYEISYDDVGCYLIRKKDKGYFEYFHRWLMMEEIEDFAKKKCLSTRNVIVHHKNHEHTDNRRANFILMTKKEHHDYHKKEKAYSNWRGNRGEFEDWYFKNNKD